VSREVETCSVVSDWHCKSPANAITPVAVHTASPQRKQEVCTACSKVTAYLRYGRRRLCDNCLEELERESLREGVKP
jgi:predicted amidophosphoribosyltransferase